MPTRVRCSSWRLCLKPKPDRCKHCNSSDLEDGHWKWCPDPNPNRGGGYWRCRPTINARNKKYYAAKKADPERYAEYTAYLKAQYQKNPIRRRYTAYLHQDSKRGLPGDPIPWESAKALMESPCSYCEITECKGLDRQDNSRGHSLENVIPACGDCNLILSDMPVEMKRLFKPALIEARKRGLLDIWKHPTRR